MNLPTIEEVADLCREYGDWRPVGPDYDLLRWLRNVLPDAVAHQSCGDLSFELGQSRSDADELQGEVERLERELREAREQIGRLQGKVVAAVPDFSNLRAEKT